MARIDTPSRVSTHTFKKSDSRFYDLSTAGGLTVSAGQATPATSPTITQNSNGVRMQWTVANSGQQVGFRYTPATAFDFTNVHQFGFEFDFGADPTGASLGGPRILMKTTSGTSYANYFTQLAYTGVAKYGKRVLWMEKSSWTVGAGAPVWSSIATIEILWQKSTRNTTVVPLDITCTGFHTQYRNQTPTVIFTFDDNDLSQYSEAYLGTTYAGTGMKDYGWTGSLYVNSNSFNVAGSQPTKMTVANAQAMQTAGWDVFNHTATHIANCWQYTPSIVSNTLTLTAAGTVAHGKTTSDSITISKMDPIEMNGTFPVATAADSTHMTVTIPTPEATTSLVGYNVIDHISSDTLSADIDTCATFLRANGFSNCNDHYAYPYGYHSEANVALLKSKGFKTARIIGSMTGTVAGQTNYMWSNVAGNPNSLDWMRLPCRSLGSTDTAATALTDIRNAIKFQNNIIICVHNLISTTAATRDFDLEEWRDLLAALKIHERQGQIQVKKMSTFYNESVDKT